MDTHRTAYKLGYRQKSYAELLVSKRLDQHFQTSESGSKRMLQRAWQTASIYTWEECPHPIFFSPSAQNVV